MYSCSFYILFEMFCHDVKNDFLLKYLGYLIVSHDMTTTLNPLTHF